MDILNEGLDPALEERLMADEARVSDMPQLQKRYIPSYRAHSADEAGKLSSLPVPLVLPHHALRHL